MAKTNAQHQADYQARVRELVREYVNRLMDDVSVEEEARDGKRYLNLRSSDATWTALEAIASLKGTTMNGMIRDFIARQLKLVAKWQLLKDRKGR